MIETAPTRRPFSDNTGHVDGDATVAIATSKRATVLIVDDDPLMRKTTERALARAHYAVVQAGSTAEARVLWEQHRPEVALVDLELGGEPGSALLKEDWVRSFDTAIVIFTGSDDVDIAEASFDEGASGYVVKPFTPNELLMQVSSALRRRRLERANVSQVFELQRKVVESTVGISELKMRLESVALGSSLEDERIIGHLSSAVCLRDDDTGRHIERVSITAAALAGWCGFVVDPAPAIRLAAAMHDVGKIGIPDWVLLKPGRLSPDERRIIERHCELGHALLSGSSSPVLQLAASVALNHHERWDGKGYPNRRRGEDIPLEARITSVADVFDALTRDRVYRAALPVETAVDVMVRDREGLFDPRVLDLFLNHLDAVLDLTKDLPDPVVLRATRIVVAGDEPILVEGLLRLMQRRGEIRVVGSGRTIGEALDAVRTHRPDVLVTDYHMPDGEAAGWIRAMIVDQPETKIIVLIDAAATEAAVQCVSAGCSGVVATTATVDAVASAIRRVHDGEVAISPELLAMVVRATRPRDRRIGDDITPRELELLGYLARGISLADVAQRMSISMNTARNYSQRVIEKLGAHSKLEAVVIATRERLITASQ